MHGEKHAIDLEARSIGFIHNVYESENGPRLIKQPEKVVIC